MKHLSLENIRATALMRDTTDLSDLIGMLAIGHPRSEEFLSYAWSSLAHRFMMSLLPSFDGLKSYNERRRAVLRVIKDRGLEGKLSEAEVDNIVELGNKIQEARSGARKSSWSDLHYVTRKEILLRQNHRCVVCGIPLALGESGLDNSPELDHIFPFVMRGNIESNTRVICKRCNVSKHDHLTYVTLGRLALGDSTRDDAINLNQLLYWAIEMANSKCQKPGCSQSSHTSQLRMVRVGTLLPWGIDNVQVQCDTCSGDRTRYPL